MRKIIEISLIILGIILLGVGISFIDDEKKEEPKKDTEEEIILNDELKEEINKKIKVIMNSNAFCDNDKEIKFLNSCIYINEKTVSSDLSPTYKMYSLIDSMIQEKYETDLVDKEIEDDSEYLIGENKEAASHEIPISDVEKLYYEFYGKDETFVKDSINSIETRPLIYYNDKTEKYYIAHFDQLFDISNITKFKPISYTLDNNKIIVEVAVIFAEYYEKGYMIYPNVDNNEDVDTVTFDEFKTFDIDLENGIYSRYKYTFNYVSGEFLFESVELVETE